MYLYVVNMVNLLVFYRPAGFGLVMEKHDSFARRSCELAGHGRSLIYLNLIVPDLSIWKKGLSLHIITHQIPVRNL